MKKCSVIRKDPFMLADIDYFVVLPSGEIALLEIKTTNYNAKDHWWKDGKEVVPINYEAQGRHYMCATNLNHVFYCCLYGNSEEEVIIRHIERDLAYEAEMIAVESEFWNEYVLKRRPPPYTEDGALRARQRQSLFWRRHQRSGNRIECAAGWSRPAFYRITGAEERDRWHSQRSWKMR